MADLDPSPRREARRRDLVVVAVVQVACVVLVAAWFATGHASAPDDGLQQLDVLSLDERVPGVEAVGGRPTMVVAACDGRYERELDESYGLALVADPATVRALALPLALLPTCQEGYVLLDAEGRVRYRTYDPGWRTHSFEQEVLLGHLDHHG